MARVFMLGSLPSMFSVGFHLDAKRATRNASVQMTIDIAGKWSLVTGAKSGIGRSIAIELGRLGSNLVLHARRKTDLLEVTKTILSECQGNVQVISIEGDLSIDSEVDAITEAALDASKGIDILYNNAAVMSPNREPFWTISPEEYRYCFQVNFVAPVRITSALLPGMLNRRFGRIIQITSGIRDQPNLMAYAASKASLDKYVRDCAAHLRRTGVLMNLLDPGWIRTSLGGPNAPNDVDSVFPGALVPALLDGEVHGIWFSAQDYKNR
jgi:NAD(P)-dependent dehydrogenase (short-subunit alcohol dehydrogenase family)